MNTETAFVFQGRFYYTQNKEVTAMGLLPRTKVRLIFAGTDITEEAAEDLISLSYTDNENGEPDDLQLTLQDADGKWLTQWLSETIDNIGLKLSAELHHVVDGEETSLKTGEFEMDQPSASGPPSQVTIRATSLDYASALRKSKKDKAWVGYSLRGIAAEMAVSGGLELCYEAAENPKYDRQEQEEETDMDFLESLCELAGISIKVTDGQLVLFDQAAYEAREPIRTIRRGDQTYTDYDFETGEAETAYTSVRVRYTNPLTGKTYDQTYVEDEEDDSDEEKANRLTVNYIQVASNEEALNAAKQLARLHNKFQKTAKFTVPGDTSAVSGVTWYLEDWGLWSGKYIITAAKHTVSSSGYVTDVELRACRNEAVAEISGGDYKVGDVVQFLGGKHYVSSDAAYPASTGLRPGPARIAYTNPGSAHPYALITEDWNQTNVWGWVDEGSFV